MKRVLKIFPSKLSGTVQAPPSKSCLQRAVICGALAAAGGTTLIKNVLPLSDDAASAMRAVEDMGLARCKEVNASIEVSAADGAAEKIRVGESATAFRFLIPVSLLMGGGRFELGKSLINRPLDELVGSLDLRYGRDGADVEISGSLSAKSYSIRGDISSQLISGMLLALPLVKGDSELTVTDGFVSKRYVEMTLDVMKRFGVSVETKPDGFLIKGGQRYIPTEYEVEGDWSYAAFFDAARFMGNDIHVAGLNTESLQADRRFAELCGKNEVDMADVPDLLPALAAAACAKVGKTVLYNAGRLRSKESDRLHCMCSELRKLGADVSESEERLTVCGKGRLLGGEVDSHGDHRIAMALTAASCICDAPVTLHGYEAVSKSAPNFFEAWKSIGGKVVLSEL